jgi:hypothetical protein
MIATKAPKPPNENKMSDGGRERASLEVDGWKSSQKVARTTVRRSLHRMVRSFHFQFWHALLESPDAAAEFLQMYQGLQ